MQFGYFSARPGDDAAGEPDSGDSLLAEINKRLTLNLLIQGAAAHTFLTAHHLVADELEAIRPGLVPLYDQLAVGGHLNYFIGDITLFYGWPSWFWWRTGGRRHPFRHHRLLTRHGGELYRASKRYLLARARQKGISGIPLVHYVQMIRIYLEVRRAEFGHEVELAEIARRATAQIWGIDLEQLSAEITTEVAFGNLLTPRTRVGRMTRAAVVGYGGVVREGERFQVVGKAVCWPLVAHELTKGTAELISLHGLNRLDAATYEQVTAEADQLEYETWLLQVGPEAWRRFLAVLPSGANLPDMLMRVARLDPAPLEDLMLAVVSDPPTAREQLARLARRG